MIEPQFNQERVRSRIEALVRKAWEIFGHLDEPDVKWSTSGDLTESFTISGYEFLSVIEDREGPWAKFVVKGISPVFSSDGMSPPDVSITTFATLLSWQGALFALLRLVEEDRLVVYLNPMLDALDAED